MDLKEESYKNIIEQLNRKKIDKIKNIQIVTK